jgi:3-methyladenine DNA glycosylase Tag
MEKTRTWVYRNGKKPTLDDQFFESMTRIIFQAGLSWKMMDKKWPAFSDAFSNFSIKSITQFTERDVHRLLENKEIIRNQQKIRATIQNAKEFTKISEEAGSFRNYLDNLLKEHGVEGTEKILQKRFRRIGHTSYRMFMWAIGEDVSHP